jgi:hypothetical protein
MQSPAMPLQPKEINSFMIVPCVEEIQFSNVFLEVQRFVPRKNACFVLEQVIVFKGMNRQYDQPQL